MNKQLIKKCNNLLDICNINNNYNIVYDDIVKLVSNDAELKKYKASIPNAISYLTQHGATIYKHKSSNNHEEFAFINKSNTSSLKNEDLIVHDYFLAISKHTILPQHEELRLARLAKDGNIGARDKLVYHNLKLVVSIAKQHYSTLRGVEFMDIIQAGNIGLLKAIEKFDSNLGFKFSTYASYWIKQYITRYICNDNNIIRIPVHIYTEYNYIETARKALIALHDSTEYIPTYAEIADYCNKHNMIISGKTHISANTVENAYLANNINTSMMYLDAVISEDDENDTTLYQFIADTTIESVESTITRTSLKQLILELFDAVLNDTEKKVLCKRYGLEDGISKTLVETSKDLNISPERVRQVQLKAIRKLKRNLNAIKQLRCYLYD